MTRARRDPAEAAVALERAIADACLGRPGESFRTDLRAFLQAHSVAEDDIAAITTQPQRLAVYRSLVRNGLSAVIVRMLPRTRHRMNAACAGRFDDDVARFLAERGPRTHYLRDVPPELIEWAAPRWRADRTVPGYLTDLAAHELAAFAVAAAEDRNDEDTYVEVTPTRSMAFDPSVRLMTYGWAVHELPATDNAIDKPAQRTAHLLAYRDSTHTVRWLELTPLAAEVTRRLLAGEALGTAVAQACLVYGTSLTDVTPDIARLLADFGERGALLGAKGT